MVTLRRAASVLKEAGIDFALAGGYAAYARGAAEPTHDVDFVLREEDVTGALAALTAIGMEHRKCPEDWLEKIYDDGRLVDLIYSPADRPVDIDLLSRAEPLTVSAITMPVLTATDLVIMRMLAYTETTCDFSDFLPVLRALREQVDWPRVAKETTHSPYAYALIELLRRLGVIETRRGDSDE
ncbi:nucleotidyltransferase family protein [Actinomadura alba]|uniref:Nucleotidyltransferase n=1 Tax=Actinomadura alba TaxID=406431 RepID=A0ABR7LNH2_9ACTN|nr:nucleotidyltransferase family protein [Actinomadura alba]MBC6466388.1 nucleotidyltransferase [Actinomadura alba]